MGVGDPQEAEYTLSAPIPAGSWRLVGDGIAVEPVDVRFEIVWRSDDGDRVLVTFEHHFEPPGNGTFDAIPYDETLPGVAADAVPGDQLVLRYQALNATQTTAYIPNGDGAAHNGRIPFIELPR